MSFKMSQLFRNPTSTKPTPTSSNSKLTRSNRTKATTMTCNFWILMRRLPLIPPNRTELFWRPKIFNHKSSTNRRQETTRGRRREEESRAKAFQNLRRPSMNQQLKILPLKSPPKETAEPRPKFLPPIRSNLMSHRHQPLNWTSFFPPKEREEERAKPTTFQSMILQTLNWKQLMSMIL